MRGWAKTGGFLRMLYGKAEGTWRLFGEEKCGLGMGNIPYIDNIQDFICSRSVSHISSMISVFFNLH